MRIAPITGSGITAKKAASLGKNARRIIRMPQGMAMERLVAPVARERPTLLEKVDWPIPPSRPDRPVPIAPAKIPPLTDCMSVRFQSASLIFWHRVKSPTHLIVEARLAMRNAGRRARSKDQPI